MPDRCIRPWCSLAFLFQMGWEGKLCQQCSRRFGHPAWHAEDPQHDADIVKYVEANSAA